MKTILVIEDEKQVRLNILKILGFEGFNAIGAEDGGVGVRMAQEQKPDLILCDIMMPVLNGYDVQTELTQDPSTRTIPLIFLTAKAERADMRLAMNLGADDYLTKPFSRDELLETVLSRLDKQAIADETFQSKLHQIRGNITTSLPAELFIPLNTIRSFLETLQQPNIDLQAAGIQAALTESYTSSLSLERLLQNFLFYALLETTIHDPDKAELFRGNCVTQSADIIADITTSKAQDYQRENDLSMDLQACNLKILEANLAKIVEEVADNAFKFSEPGSTVQIKSAIEANHLSLTISNQMKDASVDTNSSDTSTMPSSLKGKGAGLGLAIVKKLTDIHGGALKFERRPSNQTVVQINLPMMESALKE